MTPRGGKREGAGRKPTGGPVREIVSVTLPPGLGAWALEHARSRGLSRSELIAEALEALRTAPTAELPTAFEAGRNSAAYKELLAALAEARDRIPGGTFRKHRIVLPDELTGRIKAAGEDLDTATARYLSMGLMAAEHLAEHKTTT